MHRSIASGSLSATLRIQMPNLRHSSVPSTPKRCRSARTFDSGNFSKVVNGMRRVRGATANTKEKEAPPAFPQISQQIGHIFEGLRLKPLHDLGCFGQVLEAVGAHRIMPASDKRSVLALPSSKRSVPALQPAYPKRPRFASCYKANRDGSSTSIISRTPSAL